MREAPPGGDRFHPRCLPSLMARSVASATATADLRRRLDLAKAHGQLCACAAFGDAEPVQHLADCFKEDCHGRFERAHQWRDSLIVGSFASDAWVYPPAYYEPAGTVELRFIVSDVACDIDMPTPPRHGTESGEAAKGKAVMNKDQVQNVGERARQPRTGWAGMNSAPRKSQDSGPGRQSPPLHILIVEDELLPATLLEIAVMDAGHIAHKASGLSKAMSLAAAEPFDAAVLDVNLSGEQVFPLAALLRERGVPFLFASSYGKAGVPPEYQDCTMLQKPYGQDEFDSALRALLAAPDHA